MWHPHTYKSAKSVNYSIEFPEWNDGRREGGRGKGRRRAGTVQGRSHDKAFKLLLGRMQFDR